MKKKILVYDDEKRIAQIYVERLQEIEEVNRVFEILLLNDKEFEKELNVLRNRRMSFRNQDKPDDENSLLDETSIFIIDYDLLQYSKKEYLTGENVAYIARCYSKCVLIIGLNQFNSPNKTIFDLTLKGNPESYCDLNVSSTQIHNPGLWSKDRTKFRPWHWAQLIDYLRNSEKRIEDTKKHLNEPITEVVGLAGSVDLLSVAATEFIEPDPKKMTFRDFATQTGKGLKPKDLNTDDELIARIAEARLSKWLERLVLPGQDVLIDAPHLISRYPSLLKADHKSQDDWNKTANFVEAQDLPLDHEAIEPCRLKRGWWLSRPVWFWDNVSKSSKIIEVSAPWKKEATKFQFCEDSSTFESSKNCREFRAGVDSVYVRRFVNRLAIEGVDYQPRARLL